MSKRSPMNRLLSLIMAVVMLVTLAVPAMAAEAQTFRFEKLDNSAVSARLSALEAAEKQTADADYKPDEIVRVSIVLDTLSTIEMGFDPFGIADNAAALQYRNSLKAEQEELTAQIQKAIGEELDVQWNLTLAANVISANVKYGQIETIKAVDGVAAVVLEALYYPQETETNDVAQPNMNVSCGQIGSDDAWAAGYTGAGSKVAIIDTGLDTLHEAFAEDAFLYSLSQLDGDYDLLTADDIDAVLDQLNVLAKRSRTTAEDLYINSKLPFGFSYIDADLDMSHYNHEHGSHVAGISAANAYVKRNNQFVDALSTT